MFETKDRIYWVIIILLVIYSGIATITAIGSGRKLNESRTELARVIAEHKEQLGRIGQSIDSSILGIERAVATAQGMEARIAELEKGTTGIERTIIRLTNRAEQAQVLLQGIRATIGQIANIVAELYRQSREGN